MIEPTDASKCDERQVKKQAKPLTKKKEGETRIMFNQDMKTWKLGLFFVVSVMVMAGAFSNEVFAQNAKVRISPLRVQSDSVVPEVSVYYDIIGDSQDGKGVKQSVSIELPKEVLTAAYDSNNTGKPGVVEFVTVTKEDAMSDITAPTNPGEKSYVTTWDDITGKLANYAITVTANGKVTFPSITMVEDNRIRVTYHNVKVAQLSAAHLNERATAAASRSESYDYNFTVSDTVAATADSDPSITLLHPELSDIRVTPHRVKERSTRAVTVTYQAKNPMLTDNMVSIGLPADFTRSKFDKILYPTRDKSSGAILLGKPATDTIPYVTMTETVDADFKTAAAVDTNGKFTVMGDMEYNEKITVTYHNVVVSELPSPVAPRTLIRDDLSARIVASDSAASPNGLAYQADDYTIASRHKIEITTTATDLSTVNVTPDPVKGESVTSMTVTYRARDTVYGNTIEIELPTGWMPAYPEGAGSFGFNALEAVPATGAVPTSYVVVDRGGVALQPGYLDVYDDGTGNLKLSIDGDMSTGGTITVTYHNVMVQALTSSQLEDRDTPVIAQFTVTDKITGSDADNDGYGYTTEAQVTVAHPELSDIQVKPTRPVKEDSIIDMTVTYTAKDTIFTSNEITIRIPAGWDPMYPEFSAIFVDEEEVVSAADKLTTSYVKITSRLSDTDSDLVHTISADGVQMTVTGDMEDGDRIVVSFYNVKVQSLVDRTSEEAAITVTDKLSGADDGKAYEERIDTITVNPPDLSAVTVAPTRVQASSIVRDVKVTYVITDPIADTNTITIELPNDWGAAYANDGDPDGPAGFGSTFGDKSTIDLDAAATSTTATKGIVTTKPATFAKGASASKTSYVTVQYTPSGTKRTNTAAVGIGNNKVTIPVTGDMMPRDKIVVMYNNVEVPALVDRTTVYANITITDALSPNGAAYDDAEVARIKVNPPPENAVVVTPTEVDAETVLRTVKVTYSIKAAVIEQNILTVRLPENWMPAYRPSDDSSLSKSFGPLANPSGKNRTSYITVNSALTDSEYTVSSIADAESNASLTITVYNTDKGENTAVKGDNIVVTFHNVKVRGLETGETVPAKDMLTVTDTFSGGTNFAADEDTMDDVTIEVSALQRGAISRLPRDVDAEDVLDLRIRYTATEDLANPDPDDDEDTDDATYGRIQIMLPGGWTRMDGAALTDADIAVAGSPNVKFLDPDDDLTTKDHIDVDGQMVTINVDSLEKGKYVELVVDDLRVADFPADNVTDKLYVQVKVFSDSYDSEGDRGVELAGPAAHLLSRVAPTVPIATSKLASAAHPTILVNRKYLGEVTVSPGSVVAEQAVDLKIRYTATNNLATRDPAATATDDMNSTYGRIQIALPEGWGPATDDGKIHLSRQTDNRDTTYLELKKSSAVTLGTWDVYSIISTSDGYRINIDVNAMRERQWVDLTVHNLMIAPLEAQRVGSFEDITATAASEKVQVKVFSDTFADMDERDSAPELESPSAHSPVKGKFKPADAASTTQPTVTVNRKALGAVAIGPKTKVTAGSAEEEFTITYTASEALVRDSVIEVRLPDWGGVPTAYQLDAIAIPAADDKGPHVYLGGSKSRFEGSTVSVEEDGDTSIVRIMLGERGLAKNNAIVLKWEGVTVQREIQATVLIPVFSSDADADNLGVPQYPVAKQDEDKIEVIHAESGSGMVTFDFEGVSVKAFDNNDKVKSNTNASVPASLAEGDNRDLIITYTPEGDMIGDKVEAQFQITLPSGWNMKSHRASVDDKYVTKSGNTITTKLRDRFGENDGDNLEIVLENITTPDDHGNDRFVARSKNANDDFEQLSPIPMVFVGNTLADNDTVSVEITPTAAYEGEEDIDFVITVTANGPMHDSDIKITVPDGIAGIKLGKATDDNAVRKISPPGVTVGVRSDDADDENIFINTGNLNKNGTIIVRLDNVDISGVSTDSVLGFRVYTRTRGADGDTTDDDNLSGEAFALIEKADGKRSIVGGMIRTVAGNGMLAIRPDTVNQGTRQNFTLTFTATTKFTNKPLVIVAPSVIETDLVETTHVTASGVKAADRLEVSNNTITINGLNLRKSERLTIRVNNVNLSEDTGNFTWATTLDGTDITAADENANPPIVVVGTMQDDVAFEIVDDTGAPISAPYYPAASKQSIWFRFTAVNTVIQAGGRLRFTLPTGWTAPNTTDTASRATVSIVHLDDDDAETFVAKVADKWALTARGRDVILTIDPTKGKLGIGESVTIRYGTADLTKYPVVISDSARGTSGSDEDGLAIRGYYRVSSATGFSERDAGRVWVDITNVEDSTGTATVSPDSVRAGSTNNLIRVVYTAIGTMDGGAVRLTIPEPWGAAQNDDNKKPNYINVTATGGGVLTNFEVLDNGRSVQANLKTLSSGSKVGFAYGGSGDKGAMAQADIGMVTFAVESRGSSDGTFTAITTNPTIEVKGAKSGSGTVALVKTKTKSADGVINAGDDKIYLTITYTAEQTIAKGELELIVPSGWAPPQQDDTNKPGYTYIEPGNAFVSDEKYNGQSVTATIEDMEQRDTIEIHYGSYDTEDGGAHAPSAAGTSVFRVEFNGVEVTMHSSQSVIVHGGTASKLVVTAPSSVSADLGTAPVAITVEIQDDTNATAVMGSDLEVTLSSTSSTGSFTDADGDAIAGNKVTISAGSTEATVYYSDTGAGTTATVRAMAVGLDSGRATIEVTSDMDTVDENSISVSPATAKAGDSVAVTASGTAGKTATFSVGAVVTTMTMTESPANSGSYSGSFNVVQDQHDGTHDVTVNIGDASDTVASAVTVDTNAPAISGASASPSTVGNGDMVTISATVTGATSVTADVSALDDTKTDVSLTMANGAYSASVTISEDNEALNGSKTITVTAMDAAGNSAMAEAMVTLDNKLSFTSTIPTGISLFHVPLDQEGLDTVGDLKAMLGDAASLAIVNEGGSWNSGSDDVMITADLGLVLVMNAAKTVTFEGDAWGGGTSMITLAAGANLIGLPVNDPRVTNVSDIMGLFTTGVVGSIIVSSGGSFQAVTAAGASGDGPVMGDAAYLVTATTAGTAPVLGKGWSNGGTTSAAPIALAGYQVEGQTPVLDVHGSVVDEITGLAKEGFRVKVKNLSTKASLNKVTSAETAEGYNMTFVDLKVGNAARIGDVLEISADSPNPLIGIQPVRHIVTVDDVKNSRIQLENLIAYEIPAETELLRNYPNPFNPETWIPYHLAEDTDVSLTIYDATGRLVRTIDVGHQTAAKYDTRSKSIYWDGRNRFGEQVASGLYFYSLSAGDFSATRRMVILK